jgi:hypothetical protein
MAGLQLMPFPALNPWNWWALAAPRNAALAAANGAQVALDAWRCGADAARCALRQQQDLMLHFWETPATEAEAEGVENKAEAASNGAAGREADFVTPMMEATRAYSRVGKAFIVAQRNTLRALTETAKPH